MTIWTLVRRSLGHFWRSQLVVAGGVATAVAVLGGALLVGDSVRGTLRDLAVSRLGAADLAVMSPVFFGDDLAARLAADAAFADGFDRVAPFVALDGFVTAQVSGRRAGQVRVYGVDDRFWRFHGRPAPAGLEPRQVVVSQALADETGVAVGEAILVRVARPSDVPLESLHGRKDDPGRSIRATVSSVQQAHELGEFTLSQSQGRVRAVYVALEWLRQQLEIGQRANTLIVATRGSPADAPARLAGLIRRVATAEDAGLTIQASASSRTLIVGSDAGLIDEPRVRAIVEAAQSIGHSSEPVLTYLANSIRSGARAVPYSLVTARDPGRLVPDLASGGPEPPIVLNAWTARELSAVVGDRIELDYYVWVEPGELATRTAAFRVAGVVPVDATHRELAPVYPGITDSPTLDDWDPPFPIDLRRIRPVDEEYWKAYRTTPKAYIAIEDGQRLWGSRYGQVTSLRITDDAPALATPRAVDEPAFRRALAERLDPLALGLAPRAVRAEALAAAAGVTDFGEYFIYFSFFLVVSALVLAALFFTLGVEERAREIGLLGAAGASEAFVRRVFLTEALVLAATGGLVGVVAAVGYGAAIVALLGSWWVAAVGTSALTLHVAPSSLALGYFGGVGAAMVCTWMAIRRLRALSPRALLAGAALTGAATESQAAGRRIGSAVLAAAAAGGLAAAGALGAIAPSGAFFGAAFFALVAGLSATSAWYRRPASRLLAGQGPGALVRLGLRNASERPARSALSVTVVASAVFILLAVDTFRKDAVRDTGPASGVGGYALTAESLLPVAHALDTPEGREAVGLADVDEARFDAFRLRPGDDASCLNLYRPTSPRVLGVSSSFVARGRFRFGRTLAATEADRANPWRLLEAVQPDGAVPVIVDANSLTYVLHASVGDVIEIPVASGTARLRVVAALADSLFQRELLVSDADFVRLFPDSEGYRFWLVDAPAERAGAIAGAVEDRLSAFGVDATAAADRLAEFHRVENTYLTTFQSLGGLGLLVGTVGLSAVLLRNVLSRRKEMALLGAVGYRPFDIRLMLLAETGSLLAAGLLVGSAAALVAGVPAVIERGGRVPLSAAGAIVVAAVLAAGLIATLVAARAATRQPLLEALRSE